MRYAAAQKERYIVGFHGLPDAALVHAFGGEVTIQYNIIPAVAANLPPAAAAALARHPKVACVEVDGIAYAIGQTLPWGVDRVDADVVQAGGNTGGGIEVAVLDTGVGPHVDLAVAGGASFVTGVSSYADDNGHGTHVAGSAEPGAASTSFLLR